MSDKIPSVRVTRHGKSRGINIPVKYFKIQEAFSKGTIIAFEMTHFENGDIHLIPIRKEPEKIEEVPFDPFEAA